MEHGQLKEAYASLRKQMAQIYQKRILYIMMEQFLMKYMWTAGGMIMISTPILTRKYYRETDSKSKKNLVSEIENLRF